MMLHIDQIEPAMIKENDGEKIVVAAGPNARDQRDTVFTVGENGFLLLLGKRSLDFKTS